MPFTLTNIYSISDYSQLEPIQILIKPSNPSKICSSTLKSPLINIYQNFRNKIFFVDPNKMFCVPLLDREPVFGKQCRSR